MQIAGSQLALIALVASASAAAYDPVVLARGWERVDYVESEQCTGEVGSNGRFYVLSVYGLEPGEPARLTIANGDMPPIVRAVRADKRGKWQDYYVPFRPNRGEGGSVSATLTSASCSVPLGFPWRRAKGWNQPPAIENPNRR
jgi:hypothetical protein